MLRFCSRFKAAALAASLHLGFSFLVAAACAVIMFGLWYPFPYRELVGGRELFFLIVIVDVVCGPLLTFVLFNPEKPRIELIRDLTLVALIQLAALAYGAYTLAVARPVYLVFEVDRFNAVCAAEVDDSALAKVMPPWDSLPIWGPKIISARESNDNSERLKGLGMSLQGIQPSMRPDWWQALEMSRTQILQRAKSMDDLRRLHASKALALQKIAVAVEESGKIDSDLRWLPLTSKRTKDWVVLIDAKTAIPLAYAAVDGF
jgi:hypothetical protein